MRFLAKGNKEKMNKKSPREKANALEDSDEESSIKSKISSFFIVLFIILIWMGIFAILIKFNVGGFGSTVLRPLLGDVPVINKILPGGDSVSEDSSIDGEASYDNIADAAAKVRAAEQQLADAQSKIEEDSNTIAQLQAEIERLKVFEDQQNEYQQLKAKFDEEVVYNDKAPDIAEYKAYYEKIDPANAELLYKQVVEQTVYSDKVKNYADAYSKMKPAQAAGIFEKMTNNLQLVAEILNNMKSQSRGDILGAMDPAIAAKVTNLMAPKE